MKLAVLGVVTAGLGVAFTVPGLLGIGVFWVVMGLVGRAGVDHSHRAPAHDVGAGAKIGEGTGVVGHDAPDQRRHLVSRAIFKLDLAHIRYLDGHDTPLVSYASNMARSRACFNP